MAELRLSQVPLLLAVGLLGGCLWHIERPAAPAFDRDAGFSSDLPGSAPTDPARPWWQGALSGTLVEPLERTLADNPDNRRARAEVDAARARLAQARADSGPTLNATADARAQRQSGETDNSRSIGLETELPIDISGVLSERERAAAEGLRAALADAAQLRTETAREFLLAVLDGAEAEQRIALLLQQVGVAETLLRLIELRFTQGLSTSVDILQQRDQLAALHQQLPLAYYDRRLAANRLRELAGRTPGTDPVVLFAALPAVPAAYPPTTPADLLQRSARLRAAEARLAAADADFAAALADRWPTLNLRGGVLRRAASGDVATLIDGALDAALTLFDGGAKRALAAERRAELEAAGHRYLADWIALVTETDNLINEEHSLQQRISLSQQRLDTAGALLQATRRRYERGVSDYLPVLEALRGLQQQQRDYLTLQADLGRTRVRLHSALGHSAPEPEDLR